MKVDGIIFDMDGVLVDVSLSYRIAIQKTVQYLLGPEYLTKVSLNQVSWIKSKPGFNNDWDASFALWQFILTKKTPRPLQNKIKSQKDYLFLKDVFQVFYLGSKLFETIEGKTAPFNFEPGLISKEKCLVNKSVLENLVKKGLSLGIATGRPRNEAFFAISNFNLQPFFPKDFIITLEDSPREKPFPDPLLIAQQVMKIQNPVYVGDSINDVEASKKAKMPCIYVGEKLGDIQISSVNEILEVI